MLLQEPSMAPNIVVVLLLLLGASGCNSVTRPDTNMCLNNVQLLETICYNLKNDYDSNGNLNPSAKPTVVQYASPSAMLMSLDKNIGTNPVGWANLKAYLRELRTASQ